MQNTLTTSGAVIASREETWAMNWTEAVTLLSFTFTAAALVFVGYQIHQNSKLIRQNSELMSLAKESIDQQRRTLQVSMLPKAHFIFTVQVHLERWKQNIANITNALQVAVRDRDEQMLKKVAAKARKSPKGLVRKIEYEDAPDWLAAIWMAGAQYYYNFQAPLRDVWNDEEDEPWWDYVPSLLERGKDSSLCLDELLSYIDQAVPQAYADAPASISDDDFLS